MTSGTAAAQGGASNFTTFDAPGAGARMYQGTVATAIDSAGNIAGFYIDGSNAEHAFARSASGTLTSFDVGDAGSGAGGTVPIAFDGAGNLMGAYFGPSKVIHGFVRTTNGIVTTFDVPAAGTGRMEGTFPICINPSGKIAGVYLDSNLAIHGFVRAVDGTISTFDAPGAGTGNNQGTYAVGIDLNGDVAGLYIDSHVLYHGFVRVANGTIITFDAPNAGTSKNQGTASVGIDTAGDIAGFYVDANNVEHGFVRSGANGNIVSFDAPGVNTGSFLGAKNSSGSIGTFPTGMDSSGDITGTYMDANQMVRGFVRLANGTISTFAAPGATPMASFAKRSKTIAASAGGLSSNTANLTVKRRGVTGFFDRTRNVLDGIGRIAAQSTGMLAMIGSQTNGAGNQYFGTLSFGNLGFNGMNASGSIMGIFTDGDAVAHGFVRTPDGAITTFDAPGAGTGSLQGTGSFAINASGAIVGAYADLNSVIHAYVLKLAQVATTTTLIPNPSSSIYGEPVTLTATVSSTGGVVPDGETVWFMNGTTTLGSQVLRGGTASFTTTTLPGGTDSITAIYVGDLNFAGSTSAVVNLAVTKASSTTTLTSTRSTSSYGQSVTFTANISGQLGGKVTGTVTFSASSTTLGKVTVSGNAASLTTIALPTGYDSVTAVYSGDTNFAGCTSTAAAQTVSRATPTIVWATPAAIASGTALSWLQLNAVASVPGTFVYNPAAGTVLAAGSQTLQVTFTPTDIVDYTVATASVPLTVNAAAAATPTVAVTPASYNITTARALTVKVTVNGGTGQTTPTGSVVLGSGSYVSNAQVLANGSTTFEIPAGWLAIGSDTLAATYTPDASSVAVYKSTTGSSAAVTVTSAGGGTGATTTTLAMTSDSNPVTSVAAGSVVTLTATVKDGSTAVSTGQVNFCDASGVTCTDIHLLGTVQLVSGGTATFKFRPGSGEHSYKAVFAGTKSNVTSTSAVSQLTVTASGSATPSIVGITQGGAMGAYSLSATVGGFGNAAPTGTLSFLDSTYGNAVLSTSALTANPAGLNLISSQLPVAGSYFPAVAVGDFNGDGIPDVAIVNGDDKTVTILLGNGDGTFTQAANSPVHAGTSPEAITVGDFNGDGLADLVVVNYGEYPAPGSVTILLGGGNGTFTPATGSPFAVGYSPRSIAVGDFNGDGIADLAVTNGFLSYSNTSNGTVTILLGNGSGAFTQAANSPVTVGPFPGAVAVGDFNGDGNPDLAVANAGAGSVTVLLGSGTGTFTQAASSPISVTYGPMSIAAGDFNGDGVLDLAVATQGGTTLTILQGSGNGTFTLNSSSPSTGGSNARSVVVGDFNRDGIPDLAVMSSCAVTGCNNNGVIQVLLGSGSGTFSPGSSNPVAVDGSPLTMAVGDFNGDGVSDLAMISEGYSSLASVLLTAKQTAVASVTGISVSGVGPHQAVASYSGDSNFESGVSAATSLYAPAPAPMFSLASGTYTSIQVVTISDAIAGADIYYTTDGSTPQQYGSNKYIGPVTVSSSETIEAMVLATGYGQSPTASATYTLNLPQAAIPVISPAPGVYNQAITVTITESSPEVPIYYTTNGSIPTQNSSVYTGPFTVSTSETVVAVAMGGGFSASPAATAQYIAGSSATPFIYTVAGDGTIGYRGDGGLATAANFINAERMAVDSAGNLYIADPQDSRVRKVAAGTGVITTVAGNGTAGYSGDGGSAINAQLNYPQGLAVDSSGNLYIADSDNSVIRKVTTSGTISTVLGKGKEGNLSFPTDIAIDAANNIYVADTDVVWKATASTSTMAVFAGGGNGGDNGPATSATLSNPVGVALDSAGNLYIADIGNNNVRKVTASTNVITTVAGNGNPNGGYQGDGYAATSAELNGPQSVVLDAAGNLYIADQYNNVIRKVTASTGIISTFAGNGPSSQQSSGDGGPASSAGLSMPWGLSIDSAGNLYEAEANSYRVREITAASLPPTSAAAAPHFSVSAGSYSGTQTVTITDATPGASIYLTLDGTTPTAASDGYNAPINVTGTVTIRAIAVAPGYLQSPIATAAYTITSMPTSIISTVAGNGVYGFSGAGGAATSAQLGAPFGVALDSAGNLYIPDANDNVVWKVAAKTGIITIVAGNGKAGFSGDGGPATSAQLNGPRKIAVDAAGNLYIADRYNQVIRKVAATTGIITTFAGTPGSGGYSDDGGQATAAKTRSPNDVAIDNVGNLYIAESGSNVIRKVNLSTGIITTWAGNNSYTHSGDGGLAINAGIEAPEVLAFDSAYNMYVVENWGRVRKIAAGTGIISTVAGTGEDGYTGDGGLATNAEIWSWGLAVDPAGSLYLSNYFGAVRMVSPSTGVISTVVGYGLPGNGGDGGSAGVAGIGAPYGITFDPSGNLYIADLGNSTVRKVTFAQAATPALSLAAGRYVGAQTVTITETTPGAIIYYTTDGTTPTTGSSVYSGAITVSANETLQAIAIATGYSQSPVARVAYKIDSFITPTITWPTPAPIPYGTALSATQLNATSDTPGTFTYNPPLGTVLPAGTQTLTVTFTPNNTLDYTTATATVQLTVIAASLNFNVTGLDFGSQPVNTTSTAQTLIIANPYGFQVTDIAIASSGEFAAASNCPVIAPLGTCSVNVTFTPTATGLRTGTLTVTDAQTSAPQSVPLTGTGTAPGIQITPASLNFGSQVIATASYGQTMTIQNTGTANLVISNIATTGDFTTTGNCATVPAGSNCSLTVTFTPSATGARTGTVTLTDNGGGGSQSQVVNLSGVGTLAGATLTPSVQTFSGTLVGSSSFVLNATLTNTGTAPLTGIAVAILGDFSQTNTCPASLAPAATCNVSVTYAPTVAGAESGTLTVTDNLGTQTVSLVGTGLAPGASLSTAQLTFGGQLVNTSSLAQTVIFTNSGSGAVNIASVVSSANFTDTTNCSGSIPAGASCSINVIFTPAATGPLSGTITITDDAGTQVAALQGQGVSKGLAVSPSFEIFGAQQLGTASQAQTLIVTNTGTAALTLSPIALSNNFTESDQCSSVTLQASASCSISLSFSPTAIGTLSGSLVVSDTTGLVSTMATASGQGTLPGIATSPSTLSFGSLSVGTTSQAQTVTVSNTGTASLQIGTVSGTGDFAEVDTCSSQTIAAGSYCVISVTMTPTTVGMRTGTIQFNDNADGLHLIALSGMGQQAGVSVSPTGLAFGSLPFVSSAQASAAAGTSLSVTITNTGSAPLQLNGFSTQGDFTESDSCGATIAAGASCTLTVKFVPTALGHRTGTLTISDNAGGGTQLVSLEGDGSPAGLFLTPPVLNFGVQSVGATSKPQTATLANNTGQSIPNLAISASGEYNESDDCGTALADGASCTLTITVTPATAGAITGTVNISAGATIVTGSQLAKLRREAAANSSNSSVGVVAVSATTNRNANATVSQLLFSTLPAPSVTAGGNAGSSVTVAENDSAGTLVNATDTITLTVTGPGPYSKTYTATAAGGVASFNLSSYPLTVAGSYTYTVAVAASASIRSAVASETVNPGAAASVSATAGSGQSAVINALFATALQVTVKDAYSNPVSGTTVTFTVPSTGASATLSSLSATTSSIGTASVTATANGSAGAYTVTAAVSGATSASFSLTNSKATPTITWATPAPITFGTALSSTQLNATASVPGTFVYNPAAGTTPAVGSDTLSVTFTPTDSTDYTTATASVTLVVNPVPSNPVPVMNDMSPAFTSAGGAAFTLTLTGSGFVSSSKAYWGSTALTTTYVSATQLTAQVTAANIATAGTTAVTVQTPTPGGGTSSAMQFEVDTTGSTSTPPTFTTLTATVTAGSTASYAVTLPATVTSATVTCLNLPTGATCSYSSTTNALTITTASTTPSGTYQVTVVFTETVSGAATSWILLPILLLPLVMLRKKLTARGVWFSAALGLVLIAATAFTIGCGGGGSSSTTTPPVNPTHQLTSSGSVTLIVH